jgi:hypothetical protein
VRQAADRRRHVGLVGGVCAGWLISAARVGTVRAVPSGSKYRDSAAGLSLVWLSALLWWWRARRRPELVGATSRDLNRRGVELGALGERRELLGSNSEAADTDDEL